MISSQTLTESTGLDGREVPWTESTRYCFAYGSNMNKEKLHSCGVRPLSVTVAKLPGHRISFHGYEKTWDGAVETVVPTPGHEVWGLIYELTRSDGQRLDTWQDVRLDGTGAYFLFPTTVIDEEETRHPVLLYKRDILGAHQRPSLEYLEFIIQGALEGGLPSGYIEELRLIESRKAAYKVPRPGKLCGEFVPGPSCSDCAD